jgi:hypothetical protein
MTPRIQRLIGFLFLLSSAVLLVLNLKRVANLGSYWVAMPLFIVGIFLVASSRRNG